MSDSAAPAEPGGQKGAGQPRAGRAAEAGDHHVPVLVTVFMTLAKGSQRLVRSSPPRLWIWPAREPADLPEVSQVSWMWVNVPLMVVFFCAVAGIPLWLVLRRPDFGPAPAGRPGELPEAIAARYAAALVPAAPGREDYCRQRAA
jgi:hypothetical protein